MTETLGNQTHPQEWANLKETPRDWLTHQRRAKAKAKLETREEGVSVNPKPKKYPPSGIRFQGRRVRDNRKLKQLQAALQRKQDGRQIAAWIKKSRVRYAEIMRVLHVSDHRTIKSWEEGRSRCPNRVYLALQYRAHYGVWPDLDGTGE